MTYTLTKISSLKSVSDFRSHTVKLGIDLTIDERLVSGSELPILSPIHGASKKSAIELQSSPWRGEMAQRLAAPVRRPFDAGSVSEKAVRN